MSERDGKHMGIFGLTGSGKTELANQLTKDVQRLFVFDPKGSWLKKPGFEIINHIAQVKPFLDDMSDGAFRCVYKPDRKNGAKRLSTISRMIREHQEPHFWEKKTTKITLAVDELHTCFPQGLPRDIDGFNDLCFEGREYGVSLLGISPRPAKVNVDFRGQLQAIAAFNFSFPNDKTAIADAMEDHTVFAALETIEKYEYILSQDRNWQKMPPLKL